MKLTSRIIAAIMLFAWVATSAHLALEHGGASVCGAANGEHHHEGESAPDGDDHHHYDVGAFTAAQFTKSFGQKLPAPQSVPTFDKLLAEIAASSSEADEACERAAFVDSPPDARRSGWLFVVQTAHPVRGPSLAA